MSDPLDQLTDFDPGVPMSPLPPAEIRRRGDRRRHRATALAAVAAAAVVAVIVTPLTVLGHGSDRGVEPADTGGWLQRIPNGFPLGDGLTDPRDQPVPDRLRIDRCDASSAVPTATEPDAQAVEEYVPPNADVVGVADRTLILLADDAAATAVFEDLRSTLTACHGIDRQGTSDVYYSYATVPSQSGDDSIVVDGTQEYLADGEPYAPLHTVTAVVRVGNALLIATDRGLSSVVTSTVDQSTGVVAAMSVFAGPVATDPTPLPTTSAPAFSEDLLLTAAELPTIADQDPWSVTHAGADPVIECGPTGDPLGGAESVANGFEAYLTPPAGTSPYTVPTAQIYTSLHRFATPAEAQAALITADDWVTTCSDPSIPRRRVTAFGDTQTLEVVPALWRTWTYPADDICRDCDAARFDLMGAAAVGDDRVLLVSLRRVGGPLEPDGLEGAMAQLMTAAVRQAEAG